MQLINRFATTLQSNKILLTLFTLYSPIIGPYDEHSLFHTAEYIRLLFITRKMIFALYKTYCSAISNSEN